MCCPVRIMLTALRGSREVRTLWFSTRMFSRGAPHEVPSPKFLTTVTQTPGWGIWVIIRLKKQSLSSAAYCWPCNLKPSWSDGPGVTRSMSGIVQTSCVWHNVVILDSGEGVTDLSFTCSILFVEREWYNWRTERYGPVSVMAVFLSLTGDPLFYRSS